VKEKWKMRKRKESKTSDAKAIPQHLQWAERCPESF